MAGAGVCGAELVPGEAELVEPVGVADLLEAHGRGRRSQCRRRRGRPSGDRSRSRDRVVFRWPSTYFGPIGPERPGILLKSGGLSAVSRTDRSEKRRSAERPPSLLNSIMAREGRRDGVGERQKSEFEVSFVEDGKIRKRCQRGWQAPTEMVGFHPYRVLCRSRTAQGSDAWRRDLPPGAPHATTGEHSLKRKDPSERFSRNGSCGRPE